MSEIFGLATPIASYRVLDDILIWPDTDEGWDHLNEFVQLPEDQRIAYTEVMSLEYVLRGMDLNQHNFGTLVVQHIDDLGISRTEFPTHVLVAHHPHVHRWVDEQRELGG